MTWPKHAHITHGSVTHNLTETNQKLQIEWNLWAQKMDGCREETKHIKHHIKFMLTFYYIQQLICLCSLLSHKLHRILANQMLFTNSNTSNNNINSYTLLFHFELHRWYRQGIWQSGKVHALTLVKAITNAHKFFFIALMVSSRPMCLYLFVYLSYS